MLRFFSRRKPKGRKDQRLGSGGYSNVGNGTSRKPLGPTSKHKNLECKVVFLDGEDDTFHITVSYFSNIKLILSTLVKYLDHEDMSIDLNFHCMFRNRVVSYHLYEKICYLISQK